MDILILPAEIATSMADNTAPMLHPNLAETYRVRAQGLRDAIQKSASPEIRGIHPASPAYRIAAEPVLCSYGRSCERR